MPKAILLNGPPRCGKNYIANLLSLNIETDSQILGFGHYLKRSCHAQIYGGPAWDWDPDIWDSIKDEPLAILHGISWRQFYIKYSEEFIKPAFGPWFFGQKLVESANGAPLILVPDSGFQPEADVVVRAFGPENVKLVQVHRDGCNFKRDSRSYISLSSQGVQTFSIVNEPGHDERLASQLSLVAESLGFHYEKR